MKKFEIEQIAHIENGYVDKFGIPRQSGLASSVKSKIVFEEKFRNRDALRGIEEYSHLWLIWQFSKALRDDFTPTVRPPRLGGNTRVGVFATRSPFRPNNLGLTVVKLEAVEHIKEQGDVLIVSGADLLNGTPIFDIKPYIKYADSVEDAKSSFADDFSDYHLSVEFKEGFIDVISKTDLKEIEEILSNDPRPSYQNDPERIYNMDYKSYSISFKVENGTLYVVSLEERK